MIITSRDKINIEEDFKIEAGPGAGKTEFLVNHIKNIIHNSNRLSNSRKIACITYTNATVETILKRLGVNASNMIEVTTIHSFLYRNIIKPYCFFIPAKYGLCARKVKGHDELYISRNHIGEWLEDSYFDKLQHPNSRKQILLKPEGTQAAKNWISSMQCTLKDEEAVFECDKRKAAVYDEGEFKLGITKVNLEVLSKKIIDLKKIYWRKGKLDHNDVLFFSFVLIKEYPFILQILRAKFPYLFIDEYQDTNPIQSYILQEIRKKETVVGVIGDKAQSIYSFQGAKPNLFESFKLNGAGQYTIEDNHRSSNQIIIFLNNIRKDIVQENPGGEDHEDIIIYVGDSIKAYKKACQQCGEAKVTSLSRDNITSNAMKKEINNQNLNKRLLEQFKRGDTNSRRRNHVFSFIGALELAQSGNINESIKNIEWIFKHEKDSKKAALCSLIKLLAIYDQYCDKSLKVFYDFILATLRLDLPKVTRGAPKKFYESVLYRNMAVCVNIIEDSSNHITIHKAKGDEFDNVFLVESKHMKEFLKKPKLKTDEEHRVLYVAISRAEKRLFLHFEELKESDERKIKDMYPNLTMCRV